MRSVFSFTYESYQVLISLPICWFELIFQFWFNKNDTLPWSHYSESLSLRHQSCKISCWARDLYSPAALHWMTPHCYLWHWWSKIEAKSKQSDRMSVMGPTDRSHLGISMRNSPETQHLDPIHHSDLTSRMYSVWLTLYFGEIRITFFLHLRTLAVRKGNLWGQMQWPGCLWGYISIVWKESTAKKFARDLLLITSFPVFSQFRFYTSNSLTKQLRNSEKNQRFVAISTRLLDLQRASAALALWSLECVAVSVWWRAGHRRWRLSFTEFDGLAPWLFGDGCAWLFGGPCTIHT